MSDSTKQAPRSEHQAQISTQQYKYELKAPADNRNNHFIEDGKSNAVTVNTPFTVIPGLPGLSKILAKIDRTTQQDLGFTFKASTSKTPNQQGEQDLLVNVDYIGFGLMSSRFNVQFSPISIKVESGEFDTEPHWGCNASVLSSPIGLVHERAGMKGTFIDCNSTRSFSTAPEFSYQSSKTFRSLSSATGGYYFGTSGSFRISSEYVPSLERIKSASPSMEEWETIAEHIAPAIPAIPLGSLIEQGIEAGGAIVESTNAMAASTIASISKFNTDNIDAPTKFNLTSSQPYQQTFDLPIPVQGKSVPTSEKINTFNSNTQKNAFASNKFNDASMEEKAHYIVQQNDSLFTIAKKTGCSWPDIYAANRSTLKNNPEKIYPGQQLLIPENHDHATLVNNPFVQAQILANLTKHYAKQAPENISSSHR